MRGYLANSLFSKADQMFNEDLAREMRKFFKGLDLYVPQEQVINDKNSFASAEMIAEMDLEALLDSDFLVAILDGVEIDSGVACEIGAFYMTRKPIFGLCTDVRQFGNNNPLKIDAIKEDALQSQFVYRNLFVQGVVKNSGGSIQNNTIDLFREIKSKIGSGR